MNRYLTSCAALAAAAGMVWSAVGTAEACTRIMQNLPGHPVYVARSMDWPESTQSVIAVLPRGMERNGGMLDGRVVVDSNPVTWTSRYGSIVSMAYGAAPADGLNEKGLAMHMLYLVATDFGPRDESKPGLTVALWGQYALDNAATVAEALELLDKIQPVMTTLNGKEGTVHLVLEDATGDSAIIEYVGGKANVYHDPEYRVVTNDPGYDEQLALLGKMDFSNPSSNTPLPGNVKATDRLQRATYYLGLLPEPADEQQAIAGVLAISRNVSVPFGAPYQGFGIYNTEFRTAMNLSDGNYYFELTTSPNVFWMSMKDFDLSAGKPALMFTPSDNPEIYGNIKDRFTPGTPPF